MISSYSDVSYEQGRGGVILHGGGCGPRGAAGAEPGNSGEYPEEQEEEGGGGRGLRKRGRVGGSQRHGRQLRLNCDRNK